MNAEVDIDRAHLLGAPCRFLGTGIQQRGGRRASGIARQALGMGHQVLLRERRTQHETRGYNSGYVRVW